jgi:integrase
MKTIDQAFQSVLKLHWGQERFKLSGRQKEVERLYIGKIKDVFGRKRLDELKRADVKMWLISMIDTPCTSNRALEVLQRVYSFSMEMEWCTQNPCTGVKSFPEKKRKRFASIEEISKIGKLIKFHLEGKKRHGALLLFALIYTGARPQSLLGAKYSNLKVEGDCGVLTFHGKSTADSGEMESVVFPAQLMAELSRQPKRTDGYIFHPTAWRGVWELIRKQADCGDLWARDLRRTFASVGMSNGISIDAIGTTLNHKSSQTTKGYAMMFDSAKRDTTTKIASQLDVLIG